MSRGRWGRGIFGLLLVALAAWQLAASQRGLKIVDMPSTDPPLTIIAPRGEPGVSAPMVLIGHGFAGSTALMRGFALTFAHAGYTTVLWDFDGHGQNPRSLSNDGSDRSLLRNAETALDEAIAQGFGDPSRLAILGHSMGSGVAMSFGQVHPETAATIAVSPVGQSVRPDLPRNLLLLTGSLEAPFIRNAEQRLVEAGGPGGDAIAGTARELVVIPGVEHLSILYSPVAHAAAREWLDATFGGQPGATTYVDRRVIWYLVGLGGVLLASVTLASLPAKARPASGNLRSVRRRLIALVLGAVGATLLLRVAAGLGLDLQRLLGLAVGGYLQLWFFVAGLLSLLVLWEPPSLPSRRSAMGGLVVFAALWLGVGLFGESVWLSWMLIPRRLLLWPLGSILLLPWFVAAGQMLCRSGALGRLGWWLAQSTAVAGALILSLQLSPALGFLVLVLPLFPVILGLHALAAGSHRGMWSFALSGALFTSWLLLSVFPLQ